MKHLLIAVGILAVLIGSLLLIMSHVEKEIEGMLDLLDEAEWACDTGEYEEATDHVLSAVSAWEEVFTFSSLVYPERETNNVTIMLRRLSEAVYIREYAQFKMENAAVIAALTHLMESHGAKMSNIF